MPPDDWEAYFTVNVHPTILKEGWSYGYQSFANGVEKCFQKSPGGGAWEVISVTDPVWDVIKALFLAQYPADDFKREYPT